MNINWINLGFWETAHLPLPLANIITYFLLRAKCWLRRGVGDQFPGNLNCSHKFSPNRINTWSREKAKIIIWSPKGKYFDPLSNSLKHIFEKIDGDECAGRICMWILGLKEWRTFLWRFDSCKLNMSIWPPSIPSCVWMHVSSRRDSGFLI